MIYYVEDNEGIRNLVTYTLNMTGFEAEGFAEGASFFSAMERALPELILLDVMLPGEDGVTILTRLRRDARFSAIPVIMITARGEEADRVEGLEAGADDYVTKPFGMMELIARVKAVLRRCSRREKGALILGGISLDREKHTVEANGREVVLTFREFELLRFLMENPERAFDRDKLLDEVWEPEYEGGPRTVDMHVQTIRKKLGACASQIETIYGLGYKIGEGDNAQ